MEDKITSETPSSDELKKSKDENLNNVNSLQDRRHQENGAGKLSVQTNGRKNQNGHGCDSPLSDSSEEEPMVEDSIGKTASIKIKNGGLGGGRTRYLSSDSSNGSGSEMEGTSNGRSCQDGANDGSVTLSGRSTSSMSSSTMGDKRQKVGGQSAGTSRGFIIPGLAASPPRFVSLEEIMKAANGVTNMALAHEIAVDKDFQLKRVEPIQDSLEHQFKETMHKAYWDVLAEQLKEDPPDYSHAITLLNEVREGLLSLLLPHHTRLRQQINDTLDLELVKQQAENGSLDFQQYAQYVISVMAKLCAPARDDSIQTLMAITDIVPMYREILQLLDLLKLDMANFTIRQMRPHIQQHSIEYEKQKFAEFLQTQQDGLEYTRVWLKRALDAGNPQADGEPSSGSRKEKAESSDGSGRDSDEGSAAKGQEQIKLGEEAIARARRNNAAITRAYQALLDWDNAWVYPETLVMDQGRFEDLKSRVNHISLVGSMLLVTYSMVGQSVSGLAQFKEQLKKHISIILDSSESRTLPEVTSNLAVQVVKEVGECLQEHGFAILSDSQKSTLSGQIEDLASEDNRILKLVKLRVLEFVGKVLGSATASPIKIPPGLSSMQAELARLTGQFLRLVSHNRAVFGDYYVDILDTLSAGSGNINSGISSGKQAMPETNALT